MLLLGHLLSGRREPILQHRKVRCAAVIRDGDLTIQQGYSGPTSKSAVKAALLEAIEDGQRTLRTEDVVRALSAIRALAQLKPNEIEPAPLARDALAVDANVGTQPRAAYDHPESYAGAGGCKLGRKLPRPGARCVGKKCSSDRALVHSTARHVFSEC